MTCKMTSSQASWGPRGKIGVFAREWEMSLWLICSLSSRSYKVERVRHNRYMVSTVTVGASGNPKRYSVDTNGT
jgi:hypothetical protein